MTVAGLDEALAVTPVAAVQNRYSIDSRRPETDDVLRACAGRGIAFVPFFAIAGEAREGGRRAGELEPVLAVARAHGATPAQVRLAWTQGNHVLAIPGTSSLAHLAENVAAGALRLPEKDLALLGSAGQNTQYLTTTMDHGCCSSNTNGPSMFSKSWPA